MLDENQRGLLWRDRPAQSGVFMLRRGCRVAEAVSHLALVAHASDAWEWQDRIEFIPY